MRTHRILSLIAAATSFVAAYAQAPQGFSYQAVARDSDGDAVMAQPIGVQFVLHQGNPLGAVVYAETHSATTNSNGLFALTVGGGSVGAGTFSSIDWSQGPYFLEVGLDVASSGSYTNVGTQQLMSVPYALFSGRSNVPDGTEVGQILHWDGDEWVADSGLYVHERRFGIGTQEPEAPLAIETRETLKTYFETGDVPSQDQFAISTDSAGFEIGQGAPDNLVSRIFIRSSTGHVGLGTTEPDAALTIKSSTPLKEHFQNGDVPTQSDFWNMIDSHGMSTGQGNPDSAHIHLTLQSLTGHLGLGTLDPPAPLSIESRDILKTYFQTGDIPTQDDFAFSLTDSTGFGIDEGSPGNMQSRLFIQGSSGFVGIGTTLPSEKLHIESSSASGITGVKVLNTASAGNQGWRFGHLQDVDERDGAFSLLEEGAAGGERLVIRQGGNMGVNEPVPDTKLHVSRPIADPAAALDLLEGTGIVVVGPITDNVVADYRGLQARHGEFVGDVLNITATTLNLQRLGGDILIHGDATFAEDIKGVITAEGNLGLGTITPTERIHITGAIRIGDTSTNNDGTIRYNGTDFEGRKGGSWVSLTSGGSGWSLAGNTGTTAAQYLGTTDAVPLSIRTNGIERMRVASDGRIGIGSAAASPTSALDVGNGTVQADRFVISGNTCQMSGPGISYGAFDATAPRIYFSAGNNLVYFSKNPDLQTALYAHRFQVEERPSTFGLFSIEAGSTTELAMDKDGKLGLGTTTPVERLDVNGAIRIGDTSTNNDGTIRYSGTDFEGRAGGAWRSLGSEWQKVDNTESIYYNAAGHPKVGIGTTQPNAMLHTRYQTQAAADEGAMAAAMENSSTTSSSDASLTRVGLGINCTGVWSPNPAALNIGLYVSEVSGQSEASSNLAAVLNGNVVVGDITGQQVGTGGVNVLAIQNGAAPAAPSSGVPLDGVQLYSDEQGVGGSQVLHVMTGDGSIIKLYRESALTPADDTPAGPVYDPTTAALINNMRTRINELEAKLQAIGIIQ